MKHWNHRRGTLKALLWAMGPHVVVCHPCRRSMPMPGLDVPFEPCPFVCKVCGARGVIVAPEDVPRDCTR